MREIKKPYGSNQHLPAEWPALKRIVEAVAIAVIGGFLWGQLGIAHGADLPRSIHKAPDSLPYADPWTGAYIGGAIGYGWDKGAGDGSAKAGNLFGTSSFETSPQGVVGGLHLGIGTRFGGNWYAGAEVAGGFGSLDGTPQDPGLAFKVDSKTHWLMSISGRGGYILTPNVMVYGRAGWSWAGAEFTAADAFSGNFSTKPVLDGPMAGGGLEVALTQNWIAGVEYQHYFLGDINASTRGFVTNGRLVIPAVFSARVSNNIDAVLGRLSYHF